jgi:ribulose-5-phosphate 4-epimerase/fuculose-1-phosphate aldolase
VLQLNLANRFSMPRSISSRSRMTSAWSRSGPQGTPAVRRNAGLRSQVKDCRNRRSEALPWLEAGDDMRVVVGSGLKHQGTPSMNHENDDVWRARVHLAAANRLAVYDDLEEGIDNHFTMRVPGQENRYLVLPFGLHWSEARASDLIVFNEAGEVLEGTGSLELSALSIHAPLHRVSGANVILHTHQTWALALNMLEDNRLLPGSQTAAFLTRNIAYDDGYAGLAAALSEGERLAAVLGTKQILFMKNHGVLAVGDTVAQAYRRLYKLERVCRAQILAMSTGRSLALLDDEMVKKVETPNPRNSHSQAEREALYFAAMMRVLDREMPGYAD